MDRKQEKEIQLEHIVLEDGSYFKITNHDLMRPFFMSIVSDANHWMFISSNGGLTAGRKDAEHSLFPYYTEDKITEAAEHTGSKSIFRVYKEGESLIWEPFSIRFQGQYKLSRNLYKSIFGNKIIFEEINEDLEISFRYQWSFSKKYGFVRKSVLSNLSNKDVQISALDGLQNIMPYGVGSTLQKQSSNLVDAYKRSELEERTGLGIFALSAIIVDRAEPSEALKANVAWSIGLENPVHLLSSLQLNNFRDGLPLVEENDVKAEKGAYFVHFNHQLIGGDNKEWVITTDVNKNQSDIVKLIHLLKINSGLKVILENDVKKGTEELIKLVAAADGIQKSGDLLRDTRHFANSLFNIMRGGIFDFNYQINREDFETYLKSANNDTFESSLTIIKKLPKNFELSDLRALAFSQNDLDFRRLCLEYLPLKFSRRHGDPSRPWNRFNINTEKEDGTKILDYEGNWRDIFQNWEALAHSYPQFIEGMIHKFLNASTFDGYNPYRITKSGIDWEVADPEDPWSFIGYWGDHQIIYLLKFLEFIEGHFPGTLEGYFNDLLFVYVNVPYQIKEYQEILKNPKDTIEFDRESDELLRHKIGKVGADGALLRYNSGEVVRAGFIEKILVTVLAKLSNFIPNGGIWMNTQRPEWNDANNALVGNGISMVTLYYLRRFLKFFHDLIDKSTHLEVLISIEVIELIENTRSALVNNQTYLNANISNHHRKSLMDELGLAADNYRKKIYKGHFSGERELFELAELKDFIELSLEYIEESIRNNQREDKLYHAYNLMTVAHDESISIAHLSSMLEGQVAILSSGTLTTNQVLEVLDCMKESPLFRKDQNSYLLYPNKKLPGFLEKNSIQESQITSSKLLRELIKNEDKAVVEKDVNGHVHFNGNLRNANDLNTVLDQLAEGEYEDLVNLDRDIILNIFEGVFNHKAFTGRSGTFFGYEGLGSIYWHMVSKLRLAVLECYQQAISKKANDEDIRRLRNHYYEIKEGIGVHKSPEIYGAFPTDPYSHTPAGKGAQQPGMTGQVKEDIISRIGELGISVKNGVLSFNPTMLRRSAFLKESKSIELFTVNGKKRKIDLSNGSLYFTYCQVPVVYQLSARDNLELTYSNGEKYLHESLRLNEEVSQLIFSRSGVVEVIVVKIESSRVY